MVNSNFKCGELVEFYVNKTRGLGLVLNVHDDDIFCGTDKICEILTNDGKRTVRLTSGLRRVPR